MAAGEVKIFGNIEQLLVDLKGLVLKFGFVSSLLMTPELLSKKFKLLELTIQMELAPLVKLITLMPTNATPVNTGVQGGDNGGVGIGSKVGTRGSDSGETNDDVKVVGKVFTTQIPTSLPKTSTVTTSSTTTKPLTKGIMIGPAGGGSSSSKPPPTTEEMQNKGKGNFTEPLVKEKTTAIEKEMEKQRQIQSILCQRENDPIGLNKGDPSKHYTYEYIEALFVKGEIHNFEKLPKKSYDTENTNFNKLDFPINQMIFLDE
ncbi:unnamed protein product [Lactuca saligna]|uniref:Uncharacterized protein n=1 Tax=Lactuca saligna TaxID=75948 RepID=A0AA35UVA5_LACSI|nr:unnamed protein product [Lactuca saligna]